MTQSLSSPRFVFSVAVVLRAILLVYGLVQDAFSPIKYTDIDYFVFTDAARSVSRGRSPYTRDTYRYTPLLAWMLLPTTWGGWWFSFGKVLFALGDILAGWLVFRILRFSRGMPAGMAIKYASVWLLNPMVAQISTRGSSEGLLGANVAAILWAVLQRRNKLTGILLGFGIHFKIYPFIYAISIVWWLDDRRLGVTNLQPSRTSISKLSQIFAFCNPARVELAVYSLITFVCLNALMYYIYGWRFFQHSYLHHVTRIDHRHNFSPYNTLLYLNSSPESSSSLHLESLAFAPQILLSAVVIPLTLAKVDLPSSMLAQTFAFVTFNKVCTSQYFLWYLVFLPFYLPSSSLVGKPSLGSSACILWVAGQALWLRQGYHLEFLGNSTFVPGLWISSVVFFFVNVWILGMIIADVGRQSTGNAQFRDKKIV